MTEILIIEDDPHSLELMILLMHTFGYHTLVAEDGAVGFAIACRVKPDLILCDIMLPALDGYEVARRLKHMPDLRSIPLVAVTACALNGDRDRALAAGFDAYISKPIIPDKFMGQIQVFLSASSNLDGSQHPDLIPGASHDHEIDH